MEKTIKKKSAYSLANNLKYILLNMWQWDKKRTMLVFMQSPLTVAVSYLGIYLSKLVVSMVVGDAAAQRLISWIFLISLGIMAVKVLLNIIEAESSNLEIKTNIEYQHLMIGKLLDSDYEINESPAGLTRLNKALENSGSFESGSRVIINVLTNMIADFIGIISFGMILFTLSPWVVLMVLVTTVGGFFTLKLSATWTYSNKDHWKVLDRKLEYLNTVSGDFTRAKDIRLYRMTDWLKKIYQQTMGARLSWSKKEQGYGYKTDVLGLLITFIRDGFVYGILLYLMVKRGMAVSDFVLYFGVIGGFTGWIQNIVSQSDRLNRAHLNFSDMREHLDYPNQTNRKAGIPLPDDSFSIEFQHVSYQYSGSDRKVIDNINFKIEKGQKIAIVGLNGAGKTTLVKLICGLYRPTEGVILANGKPIDDYNIHDYYTLFSAVFQEIFIFPYSILQNITSVTADKSDRLRAEEVLRMAGLWDKVSALPMGLNTRLVKSVYEDGTDLSGGELQKLALARALYKSGKFLILDEPTAALDPIAESHIYQTYSEMTAGHSSVFISHRLASTRFCDTIFFIENGAIAEAGSHDALMAKQGKYFELFEVQGHYYREEATENE